MGRSSSLISSFIILFRAWRISPSEEMNSVYIRSAPFNLQTDLNGGSLTSSMGARSKGNSPNSMLPILTIYTENGCKFTQFQSMLKHPPLINVRHPFVQLLLVISMLIPSVFFFAYIGLFLVQPIYHVSPMDMINALSNPASFGSNQNYVAAAKLIQGLSELGFLAPAFLFAILMG